MGNLGSVSYTHLFHVVFGTDWETVKNKTYTELINWDLENDYRGYAEYMFDNNIAAYSKSKMCIRDRH